MKRLLIFGLLGPVLGYVVMLITSMWLSGQPVLPAINGFIIVMIPGYLIGLPPALAAATADALLALKIPPWPRAAATFCAGYLITTLAGWLMFKPEYTPLRGVLMFGCVGAFPAAMCSWLSGQQNRAAPSS